MVGNLKEDGRNNGTVTRILETCGLKVKFIAVTGDGAPEADDPLDGINMKFNLKGRIRQKQMVELDTKELEITILNKSVHSTA